MKLSFGKILIGFFVLAAAAVVIVKFKSQVVAPTVINPADELTYEMDSKINSKHYVSKHGFSVDYPIDWLLSDTTIEDQDSLESAQKIGANHFAITSYAPETGGKVGEFTPDVLKAEGWVYTNVTQSLEDWLPKEDVLKTEKFEIEGKPAYKVWVKGGMVDQALTVYFKDGDRGLMLHSWPYNTLYSEEFDLIAKSFKFN